MLMMPTAYTRAEVEYDLVVGNDTVVSPSYDPHCANGEMPLMSFELNPASL